MSIGSVFAISTIFPAAALLHMVYWISSGYAHDFSIPSRIFWLHFLCGAFVGVLVGSLMLLELYYKGESENVGKGGQIDE
jgi:hypothetical protein